MATFGCSDIGVDCAFKTPVVEGQEEDAVQETLRHAQAAHPDLAKQLPEVETKVRAVISELMRQAKFSEPTV